MRGQRDGDGGGSGSGAAESQTPRRSRGDDGPAAPVAGQGTSMQSGNEGPVVSPARESEGNADRTADCTPAAAVDAAASPMDVDHQQSAAAAPLLPAGGAGDSGVNADGAAAAANGAMPECTSQISHAAPAVAAPLFPADGAGDSGVNADGAAAAATGGMPESSQISQAARDPANRLSVR